MAVLNLNFSSLPNPLGWHIQTCFSNAQLHLIPYSTLGFLWETITGTTTIDSNIREESRPNYALP